MLIPQVSLFDIFLFLEQLPLHGLNLQGEPPQLFLGPLLLPQVAIQHVPLLPKFVLTSFLNNGHLLQLLGQAGDFYRLLFQRPPHAFQLLL